MSELKAGKYQAYPEYKDSGVEWLEDVPSDWNVIKIKHLSAVKRGASPRPIDDPKYFDEEGSYAWVRIADVSASNTYLEKTPQTMSELGSSMSVKLEPDQLFLSIAGTVGKPCINKIKACIHDGFVYFPELKIPNKYLFYVFAGEQAYKGLGKMGTQLNLNTDTVGDIKVALPKQSHDIALIINFLDHETAKIDTLIEKQQQLIKLLKEKRQAVISHAVTKGLNPQAPMKDFGVEWLGEVPEHWIVKKLKYACELISKKVSTEQKNVIALENIESWSGKYITTSSTYSGEDVGFVKGDILFGKLRPYLAKVFQAKEEGVAFGDLIVFRPLDLLSEFCFYLMISEGFITTVDSSTYGSKMPRASTEFIAEMFVIVPPQKEQVEIAQHIQSILTKYDKIESEAIEAIRLMQERRTALISAAVTGKIDVRNWEQPND